MPNYNCACADGPSYRTLAQLRTSVIDTLGFPDPITTTATRTLAQCRALMIPQLGYSAQLASPPPGLNDSLNAWLNQAQQTLFRRIELDQGGGTAPATMSLDADTTTLDFHPVVTLAIALAKTHLHGPADAKPYFDYVEKYLSDFASRRPPNLTDLVTDALQNAQNFLYREYDTFHTTRLYRWDLVAGERYYDIAANEEQNDAPACTKLMDPGKIEGVWVSGASRTWRPLVAGIRPELYDDEEPNGSPAWYEVRQCLEIWPPPDAQEYTQLRVKGDFGLLAFSADGDYPTIDDELIRLFALAGLKASFGQKDAQRYDAMWRARMGSLVAESHSTQRFVPGNVPMGHAPIPRMDTWLVEP